jgi:hypothetical protein
LVGQPHAVVGHEEREALRMHAESVNFEDERHAVTLADALRRGFV